MESNWAEEDHAGIALLAELYEKARTRKAINLN
jgi:hypothetical protein